jgi:hypothetical protein
MKKHTLGALPFAVGAMLLAAPGVANAAPAPHAISVTPSTNLVNGQTVTVSSTGWPAGAQVYVLQCADTSGAGTCDTANLVPVTVGSTGAFSSSITVHTGAIGSKSCNAGATCYIAAGTANQSDAGAGQIVFKSAAVATPTPTTPTPAPSATTAPAAGSGSGQASVPPVSVAAGSGGTADRESFPLGAAALGMAGLAVAGAGVRRLRR